MLKSQPAVKLSGGLEPRRLRSWHVDLMAEAHVKEAFFAYDTPDDLPPLEEAAKILKGSPWYRPDKCLCYCLIGYPGDTLKAAEERLLTTQS